MYGRLPGHGITLNEGGDVLSLIDAGVSGVKTGDVFPSHVHIGAASSA